MPKLNKNIPRNRIPVLVAYHFVSGFVLWYLVEKLFLAQTLGLSGYQIVALINIGIAVHLVIDLPSSILADRWSRSRTLAMSLTFAFLAALLGGLATSFWSYVPSVIAWSLASAFHMGVARALVYDVCVEEGKEAAFSKVIARMENTFLLAVLIASALGGLAAELGGLRAPYFLSLVLMLPMAWVMLRFKEPKFHRRTQQGSVIGHLKSAAKHLGGSRVIILIVLLIIINDGMVPNALYEFRSLVFSKARLSLVGVGLARGLQTLASVAVLATVGVWLQRRAGWLIGITYGLAAFSLWLVPRVSSTLMVVAVFSMGGILGQVTSRWLQNSMQYAIASSERAASGSIVSSIGSLAWLGIGTVVAQRLQSEGAYGPSQVAAFLLAIAAGISFLGHAWVGRSFHDGFANRSSD